MISFRVNRFGNIFVMLLAITVLANFTSASMVKAAPSTNVVPYIVGGHGASEKYPGMASLQMNILDDPDFHICGATLVSRLYAVTSAHCVTNWDGSAADPSLFHLRIGSDNRHKGGVSVGVEAVLPHADWDWVAGDAPMADIALLKLDDYVQLQPFEVAPRIGKNHAATRLLGWGSTEPSGEGPAPLNLQELDTKLVKPGKCKDGGITAGEICVASQNGTDGPCFGDSGGPALQKVGSKRWSVVGSTSRMGADWCGEGNTVYTDLTYYRPWMYKVMRTGIVPPTTTTKKPSAAKPRHYNWSLPVERKAMLRH